MGAMASRITSLTIVYSADNSGADQRNAENISKRQKTGPEDNLIIQTES